MLFGKSSKRDAMPGQERLVGRHHGFSGSERGFNRPFCRITIAANQLHEHIDIAIGGEGHRIADPTYLGLVKIALLVGRARGAGDDLDSPPAAGLDQIALLRDLAHHGGTDRAEPGKTRFQGRNHLSSARSQRVTPKNCRFFGRDHAQNHRE